MSSKLTALSEISIPALEDLLYTVDDPSGTPASFKLTTKRFAGLLNFAPQLRLSTESGTPVSITDRVSQGTLYAVPSTPHGIGLASGFVRTYDGTRIKMQETGEVNLSLTLSSGKLYDVFLKNSDLSLVLSSAWTNDTTRADSLARVSDLIVANADNSYLWLGTICASGSNAVADATQQRFVWNAWNRLPRYLYFQFSTASATYGADAYRVAGGDASGFIQFISGDIASQVHLSLIGNFTIDSVPQTITQASVAIGINDVVPYSLCHPGCAILNLTSDFPYDQLYFSMNVFSQLNMMAPLGLTTANWLETGDGNTGVLVWSYTKSSGTIAYLSGLGGWIFG